MSVRRLAEASVQPPSFAFSGENAAFAEAAIRKFPEGRQQSAVIPLLMRAQEQEGWVTKAAIETVADMLGMPYIRALEVATFYTQFQLKPVGSKAHVQVCGTTPCMLRGAEALIEICRSKIHHEQFRLNAAGTLSWEEVECLGACVNAPMVMVFKDTYEDLTPERLAEIIDAFEGGQPVTPGPQIERIYSAPASGLTSLRDEAAIVEAAGDRDRAFSSGGGEGDVPPSKAGRPASDAPETNETVKSPSPQKAPSSAENASPAPAFDAVKANQAEPAVEGVSKQRRRKTPETLSGDKAPELLKGEPAGPTGKRPAGSKRTPKGAPSPEGGNMTPQGTPTKPGEGEA